MSKIIKETLGTLTRLHPPQAPQQQQPPPPRDQQHPEPQYGNLPRYLSRDYIRHHRMQGVDLFKFNFRGWQRDIIQALEQGNSIYVVASPGSGKTAPVSYYWAQHILGINPRMIQEPENNQNQIITRISNLIQNPETFSKILYLCPVRQLVYDIHRDFRRYLGETIIHLLRFGMTTPYYANIRDNILRHITNYDRNLEPLIRNKKYLVDQWNHLEPNQTPRDREQQERIMKDIEQVHSNMSRVMGDAIRAFIDSRLLHIRTKVDQPPNHVPVVSICIYESGSTEFDRLGGSNNIRAIIVDEAHTMQSQMSAEESRPEQITRKVFPVISRLPNTCRLILLSGTINPTSAQNLCRFITHCLRTPIRPITTTESRNPSDLKILPMDSLKNEQKLVQLLTNPPDSANVIMIFSKEKILDLAKKALEAKGGERFTAQQIDRGDLQDPRRRQLGVDMDRLERHRRAPQTGLHLDTDDLRERINRVPGAENIQNDPFLLKCVLSGFGYIFRQDDDAASDEANRISGRNQMIVADLFSKGKIKTILATHAIGIGLNLKVKNMYVPEIFENRPLSDEAQLYNRVGRMSFMVSNIYTPADKVDMIVRAISANNADYENREIPVNITNIESFCRDITDRDAPFWKAAMRPLFRGS